MSAASFKKSVIGLTLATSLSACSGIGGFDVGGLSPSKVLDIGQNAYKAATLSDDDVKKLASEFIKVSDEENTVAPASNAYAKRLQKIVAKHKQEDGLTLNYKVYLTPDVNAFSTADGSIRVYSGLMDKMTDDELLFVIGHEIGHIKHGHRKARMQRGYAAAAAVGAIGQGLNAGTSGTAAGFGLAVGGKLFAKLSSEVLKAQFSQGDETESDEYGLHLVHNGHKPAEAAVSALLKLGEDSGETSSTLDQFTSSHPDPEARAEHMRELIPSLGAVVAKKSQGGAEKKQPHSEVASKEPGVEEERPTTVASTSGHTEDAAGEGTTVTARLPAPHEDSAGAKSASIIDRTPDSREVKRNEVLGKGWVVQVGAYADSSNAEHMTASLSGSRLPVVKGAGAEGAGGLHRVMVGPFRSASEAHKELDTMKQQGIVSEGFVRAL